MTGHIAGLGYSQRVNANGRPLVGWRLYIYDTGTSTPVTAYQDYALSIEHTHPIEADATGVMQMFWVADGTYRVRGTDADGNELFDDDGIVALGPSSGTGGGSSGSVSSSAIAQTGDFLWLPIAGARTGWVRANARTIGSAASGATERANADAEELFLYLWNNFSDSLCPVTGGRGGSAAADWAANKVIATLDMRTRAGFGLDDMGNTAAGITGGSTAAAAAVGATTFTVSQANLPNVNFSHSLGVATGISNDGFTFVNNVDTESDGFDGTGGSNAITSVSADTTSVQLVLGSSVVSGTIASGGSGTAMTIVPRSRAGTWYIKL